MAKEKKKNELRWEKPELKPLNGHNTATGDCTRGSGIVGTCNNGEAPGSGCTTGNAPS